MSAIPRNEDESFEDYKERRMTDAYKTKKARKGIVFHDSFNEGTYVTPQKDDRKQALRELKKKIGSRQLKKTIKQMKREGEYV